MRRLTKLLLITFVITVISIPCKGQSVDSVSGNLINLPSKFFSKVQKRYDLLEKRLSRKSDKYLQKLQKQEKKLNRKMLKNDSSVQDSKYIDSIYLAFKQQLKGRRIKTGNVNLSEYNAYIDTLSTSLNFLNHFNGLQDKVKLPIESLNELKSKFNEYKNIKEFIAQRKEHLKSMLAGYTKLPSSLQKEYTKLNKHIYYYQAQVQEYKNMLKDPEKIERKALTLLSNVPAFEKFMKEHSALASLFRIPGSDPGSNNTVNLAGLQTRASVQGMIQQRIAAGGPNAASQLWQNLSEARTKLNELKDKLLKGGVTGSGGDVEMPDFKPNQQRSKTLWQRLEYGFDIQFAKSNGYLPSTSDIAVSIGYKLNDKSVICMGLTYKLGLGSIEHIRLSSEGVGMRSYLDWKIKGQWYATGGYEMSYQSAFKNIAELEDAVWQRSALVGVSKQYKVSKKLKGEVKVLYDFMAERQWASRFKIRYGYKF